MFAAIIRALRSPGANREVVEYAPKQTWDDSTDKGISATDFAEYRPKAKPRLLDRALDRTVRASGSLPVFIFIQVILLLWAFLAIPFHHTSLWPVIISDVQAIFSYMFDSFLMRQQLNAHSERLFVATQLKSRAASVRSMFAQLRGQISGDIRRDAVVQMAGRPFIEVQLPSETRFVKIFKRSSAVLGHILFIAFFWACMILWLCFGPANHWSNQWLLDINSATSALMVFVFSFLAILREQTASYCNACVDAIFRVDVLLEMKLRLLTGDKSDNPEVVIPPAKITFIQRAINYYADLVGTLVGIALLIIVLVAWIAIGPAFKFNQNWWLIIGTYAGLIGLHDSFVLRNIQAKFCEHEAPEYADIDATDLDLLRSLNITAPASVSIKSTAISHRLSERVNRICGHQNAVIFGILFIVGLLIGASMLRWTETGQLLCNFPPSILESFLMIVLISGDNSADAQRWSDITNVFEHRRLLLAYVETIQEMTQRSVPNKSSF